MDTLLQRVASDVRTNLQEEIENDDLIYTGQLKNSWDIHKQEDGSYIVGSPLIWAQIQNEGRLPGTMPPVKALIPWVFQKIGAKNEQELKSIAFAVAKKIGERGIEGTHYVKRALFRMEIESL